MRGMNRAVLLAALLATASAVVAQSPAWRWRRTEDLGCLTPPAALAQVGMSGTDLGVSFPQGDRLVFLFGDSWTLDRQDWDHDSVAFTKLAPLGDALPELRWSTQASGRFRTLAPKDMVQRGMDVPVEGVVVDGRTYVFFSSGFHDKRKVHSHSMLVHGKDDDLRELELDHRVETKKFVNVSVIEGDADVLWIYGTGAYRKSSVFLARVARDRLADRSSWRYWPEFSPNEADARPLVHSDCIGELSVRRVPGSDVICMAYNASQPRGIHLRTATSPTGPWSDPEVIFDPFRDAGYGVHMHQSTDATGYDDGLSMPGREREWGGEYGPYLVPEWCDAETPGVLSLVYTLSTWNPYTVRLLRTVVVREGVDWSPPESPAIRGPEKSTAKNLAFEKGRLRGWKQEGDAFVTYLHDDGSHAVLTYVKPRGDAVHGRLWQEFTLSTTARELRGTVHGGSEEVQLWHGDRLVYRTSGRRSNDVDVPFRWRLDELRGEKVRLQIVDASTAPWGFVAVRGLHIVE